MSLFDKPKPILNPVLWNGTDFKPEAKRYILDLIDHVFPEHKIADLIIIGSNVGHQYSDTSDIDINVMGVPGETYEKWHKAIKHSNDRMNFFPGTRHQINFMFQDFIPRGDRDWANSLGAYNILSGTWEKKPIPFDKIGDPLKKYEREIHYAKLLLTQIESEVALMNEIRLHDPEQYEATRKRLALLFKPIDENRKTAYRYGTGTPALQEYNIVYKIVESSPYGLLMHEMVSYFDDLHEVNLG